MHTFFDGRCNIIQKLGKGIAVEQRALRPYYQLINYIYYKINIVFSQITFLKHWRIEGGSKWV